LIVGWWASLWQRTASSESPEQRKLDAYTATWLSERGAYGAASADQVLSNSAVAARCVSLRSELLASVPLFLFKRTSDGGRERAEDNALYSVLHDEPNPLMTAFEFRELMIRNLDLHGNAYARIERNGRGEVIALWPLSSRSMEVQKLSNGRLRYKWSDERGGTTVLLQEEVLHLRNASRDGIIGQSPIATARGSLSLAIAQAETANSIAANGFRISGALQHPAKLGHTAVTNLQASMEATHSGPRKAGRVMVLEEGMKFTPMSFSPEDAEFLASRKLSNEDTARIFGVPPTAAGIIDKGTYSNTEQEAQSLIQNCLGPLAARLEAGMQRCLLTANGRRTGYYIEHDMSGLLRGSIQARFEAYRVAREIGALSANDVRRMENQPPLGAAGDVYNQPSNWVPLGTSPAPATTGASNA
jgi:HK97 family phage portal protein